VRVQPKACEAQKLCVIVRVSVYRLSVKSKQPCRAASKQDAVLLTHHFGAPEQIFRVCTALLEHQFQCELEVSRIAGSSRLSKRGIVDRVVSDLEVCVVQNIEGLRAKLQLQRLGKPKILEN